MLVQKLRVETPNSIYVTIYRFKVICIQTEIDECAMNPCENNGTCTDLIADYYCDCEPGFTDKNCSVGK